ncbi:MAG: TIGR03943 family putative permease subunit [[Clostridium] innocuum]|nr:TIGR03943 family protein [[Clostridium] innocuum]
MIRHFNKEGLMKLVGLAMIETELIYLLLSGELIYFIHPRMIPYMYVACAIVLYLICSQVCNLFQVKFNYCIKRYLIVIIPFMLCCYFMIKDGSFLDMEQKARINAEEKEKYRIKDLSERINDPSFEVSNTEFNEFNRLLFDKRDILDGKEICYTVFVHYDSQLKQNQFMAARLTMVCCAADMIPNGLVVIMKQKPSWKEGTWIKLTGKLIYMEQKDNPFKVPFVSFIDAHEVEKPIIDVVYPDF